MLPDLQTLVGVSDDVAGRMHPVLSAVGQARAERTPGAGAVWSRYQALQGAFVAARTLDQMTAVQSETGALEQAVAADLAAHRCGHPVPAGHVIALDLTAQEIVFYDNGCALRAAPVTTGPPGSRMRSWVPAVRTAAGSHGCVHLPVADMAWAYGWAALGTPVIVTA